MLKKTSLKQGSLLWEKAKSTRIGSSEIFDIVRYYATDEELQNCGINAEKFKEEKPYTTAWALYHKILGDGIYKKEALEPEFAEYGHTVESYGVHVLQKGRTKKLKAGPVYLDERFIASLDIEGISDTCDLLNEFYFGPGRPPTGKRFVCEQKTMHPIKRTLPFKYIIQAQYQLWSTGADFYILQLMILKEDTPFIRGKICQMSRKKKFEYLDENMQVIHYYFKNNEHLSRLISTCCDRFFDAVKNGNEPDPYIECDTQKNIIESIRLNSQYNYEAVVEYDLLPYYYAKTHADYYERKRKAELQKIIEAAKDKNVCKFIHSEENLSASFSKNGSFLMKEVFS